MKKITLAFALLLPLLVFAGPPKTFTWTPPTSNTDGTVLLDSEISSYNIYCRKDGGGLSLFASVPNTGNTDRFESGPMDAGAYECQATTIATNGIESDLSNVAAFTVDPSEPEAPSGFAVELP